MISRAGGRHKIAFFKGFMQNNPRPHEKYALDGVLPAKYIHLTSIKIKSPGLLLRSFLRFKGK
jgi:hypothetical protein